jgi:hypothetical protein
MSNHVNRTLMLLLRDHPMVEPDRPTRLAVRLPRRLRVQLGQLARIKGLGAGQLAARILSAYMARHCRRLRGRN